VSEPTPEPSPEAAEETVALLRTSDATRARTVVALLEARGLWSLAQGLEDANLGALAIVRVRAKDVARAQKLLRSIERGRPVRPLGEEDEVVPTYRRNARRAPDPEGDGQLVRLKRVAVMTSIVFPGGGHLYVRRYDRALLLWGLYAVIFFAAVRGLPSMGNVGLGVMALDAVGATWLCDVSQGRDVARSPRRFAVHAAVALVVTALYAMALSR
jgi:hypothetical protein